MKCTNPFLLEPQHIWVACGKCIACRINRTDEWATRLMDEYKTWPSSSFVTLTYDNEHYPEDESLSKKELQNYIKRLRKNSGKKLKYFACGEYGEKHGRAHYHAILFGMDIIADNDDIIRSWQGKGNIDIGTVTFKSCRYVAKYVYKKYNGVMKQEVYGDKESPFKISSQGLGLDVALEYGDELKDHLYMIRDGRRIALPRYYRKKLQIEADAYKDIITDYQTKLSKHYAEKKLSGKYKINYIYKLNKQRNEEYKTKMHRSENNK